MRHKALPDQVVVVTGASSGIGLATARMAAKRGATVAFGGFDTWADVAGLTVYGPLRAGFDADNARLIRTNLWGAVFGSLVAVGHLRRRGGADQPRQRRLRPRLPVPGHVRREQARGEGFHGRPADGLLAEDALSLWAALSRSAAAYATCRVPTRTWPATPTSWSTR